MNSIRIDITKSKRKSPYFRKDIIKFANVNKLIAFGAPNTSSRAYAETVDQRMLNTYIYKQSDVVGVTINGGNKSQLDFRNVSKELQKAINANSTIVADKPNDRIRSYNSGERLVAEMLLKNNYKEIKPGVWKPIKNSKEIFLD